MHYQEKVDGLSSQRPISTKKLRTLFDCFSDEWEQTNFDKKEELLLALYLSEQGLEFYIEDYVAFYKEELANKAYVIDALPKSIRMLVLNVKDELLRVALLRIYIDWSKKLEGLARPETNTTKQ